MTEGTERAERKVMAVLDFEAGDMSPGECIDLMGNIRAALRVRIESAEQKMEDG